MNTILLLRRPSWKRLEIVREVRPPAESRFAQWLGVALVAYLAAILLLRLVHSRYLEHDEAEELFRAQTLAWGYSPQPPLYAWLVWGAIQVFGTTVLAITVVKAVLLGALYFLMDRLTKRVILDPVLARVATLSLLFLPLFAWEMPRMAVSVLLSIATVGCLNKMLHLRESRSTRTYLLLGWWLALGTLSKYNFVLVVGALCVASLSMASMRTVLFNRRMFLALGLAAVLVLPHALWAWQHFSEISTKITVRSGMVGSESNRMSGVLSLIVVILSSAFPLLLVYGLTLGQRFSGRRLPFPEGRFVERFLLATILALFLLVIFAGVRSFRTYWIAPTLLVLPMVLLVRIDRSRLPQGNIRRVGFLAVLAALTVVVVNGATLCCDREDGKFQTRDFLIAEQVRQVQEREFTAGNIITSDELLAGYQRLYFPDSAVHSVSHPSVPAAHDFENGPWLIVWNATYSAEIPESMREFLRKRFSLELAPAIKPDLVEVAPRGFGSSLRRLGYLLIPSVREES